MNYIIKASTDSIFWNQDNGNYPNQEIINNLNFNIDVAGINFINYFNASIASERDDITYIKVEGGNHTYYYFVNSVNFRASDNVNVYSLSLDVFSTLILEWIDKNKNNELCFLRTNKYDYKTLEFSDTTLDTMPKYFDNWQFGSIEFKKSMAENSTIFSNESVALKYSNSDILNAHKYYVFSTGRNGGFQFLPVLSRANQVTAITGLKIPDFNKLIFEGSFNNYKYTYDGNLGGDKTYLNIPANVEFNARDALEKNLPITYWANIQTPNQFLTPTLQMVSGNNYTAMPRNVLLRASYYFAGGVVHRYLNQFIDINGINVVSRYSGNQGASNWGRLDNCAYNSDNLIMRVYDTKTGERLDTIVDNSLANLEQLRVHQELSNRFVGIFYLPHILQIGDLWEYETWADGKKYLTLNLNPEGHDLTQFNCGVLETDSNAQEFNSIHINPFIFRYFAKKYFGNLLPLEFYVESDGNIVFGGKLFFSNGGVITVPLDLLSVVETTISYGYQLPMGINNYMNYVNASLNTINTSYEIQKQNFNMKQGEIIAGGIMDYINVANGVVGGIFEGDIKAAGEAVLGGVNNIISSAFSGVRNKQKFENWQREVKAQYADVKNTTGNSVVMSNVQDATNLLLYDKDGTQFTGYEFQKLTNDTLKNINNYLYLHGYPLVHFRNLKDFINEGILIKNNSYIIAESLYINSGIGIDFSGFNKSEILLIKEFLIIGFRIWGDIPKTYGN